MLSFNVLVAVVGPVDVMSVATVRPKSSPSTRIGDGVNVERHGPECGGRLGRPDGRSTDVYGP
jgi:hypothetical protein